MNICGLACSSSLSSSPWSRCTSDSSFSMTCTTSMSVSWTPCLSKYVNLFPNLDPWVLSYPQPCPSLLLPNILRRPLYKGSPVLAVPGLVKGCPSLPCNPPSGSTHPNFPQAPANTPSCTRVPPSSLPQIPVPPLGTLDGLVPGIYAFCLSTGHICIPAIGGYRGTLA